MKNILKIYLVGFISAVILSSCAMSCADVIENDPPTFTIDNDDQVGLVEAIATCTPTEVQVSDSATLKSNLSGASNCTTFQLSAGVTYSLDEKITVSASHITLAGDTSNAPIIELSGDGDSIYFTGGINIAIQNIDIKAGDSDSAPIYFNNVKVINLENINLYRGDSFDAPFSLNGDNSFNDHSDVGIDFRLSKYINLKDVSVMGSREAGVKFLLSAYINIEGTLTGNDADATSTSKFHNNTAGIFMFNVAHVRVNGIQTTDNAVGVIFISSPERIISSEDQKNYFKSTNITIDGNNLSDNNQFNFCPTASYMNVLAVGNNPELLYAVSPTCHIPTGAGLIIVGVDKVLIEGNILQDNTFANLNVFHGMALTLNPAEADDLFTTDVEIKSNTFTTTPPEAYLDINIRLAINNVETVFGNYTNLVDWYASRHGFLTDNTKDNNAYRSVETPNWAGAEFTNRLKGYVTDFGDSEDHIQFRRIKREIFRIEKFSYSLSEIIYDVQDANDLFYHASYEVDSVEVTRTFDLPNTGSDTVGIGAFDCNNNTMDTDGNPIDTTGKCTEVTRTFQSSIPVPDIITDGIDLTVLVRAPNNDHRICIVSSGSEANTGGTGRSLGDGSTFPSFNDINIIKAGRAILLDFPLSSEQTLLTDPPSTYLDRVNNNKLFYDLEDPNNTDNDVLAESLYIESAVAKSITDTFLSSQLFNIDASVLRVVSHTPSRNTQLYSAGTALTINGYTIVDFMDPTTNAQTTLPFGEERPAEGIVTCSGLNCLVGGALLFSGLPNGRQQYLGVIVPTGPVGEVSNTGATGRYHHYDSEADKCSELDTANFGNSNSFVSDFF